MGIGMQELLVILALGLVVFGSRKMPEIGSSLGQALRNFKKATTEPDEIDITSDTPPAKKKKETNGDA